MTVIGLFSSVFRKPNLLKQRYSAPHPELHRASYTRNTITALFLLSVAHCYSKSPADIENIASPLQTIFLDSIQFQLSKDSYTLILDSFPRREKKPFNFCSDALATFVLIQWDWLPFFVSLHHDAWLRFLRYINRSDLFQLGSSECSAQDVIQKNKLFSVKKNCVYFFIFERNRVHKGGIHVQKIPWAVFKRPRPSNEYRRFSGVASASFSSQIWNIFFACNSTSLTSPSKYST